MLTLLVVEDNERDRNVLSMVLPEAYALRFCTSGRQALELLAGNRFDAVLLDIDLPDLDGLVVLDQARRIPDMPPVIIVSGFSDLPTVVKAVHLGADDYIAKPFTLKDLEGALSKALERRISRSCALSPGPDPAFWAADGAQACTLFAHPLLAEFIGRSEAVMQVKRLMVAFGPSPQPVLITGESGTGKELTARILHAFSSFSEGPLVPVNCGALPESIMEPELFGSERGAFTDAVSRPGKFELADGGTLFLDEIAELSLSAQAKLLRVLEQKEVCRVGGSRIRKLDLRVISATNMDVLTAVEERRFRADLFYRINILPIHLPPLRDHMEDLEVLVEYFLARQPGGKSPDRPVPVLSPAAWHRLQEHSWPGNIRELRNVIERARVLSGNREPIDANCIRFG